MLRTACLFVLMLSLLLLSWMVHADEAVLHPLDPLTKEEIQTTVSILKAAGKTNDVSRYVALELHEPPKTDVLTYTPDKVARREAFVIVYERDSNRTFEAVVDVREKRVLSWKAVAGVQPVAFGEDFALVSELVPKDGRWQEAMRKRGITDFQQVIIEPWAGTPGVANRQALAVTYLKGGSANYYAHPIEGVIAYVDLNAKRVEKVVDAGIVPPPKDDGAYEAGKVGALRSDLKPLRTLQAEGPSFMVEGHEVRWQKWRFRFGFNAHEGLVLYTVGYEDQGRVRSILYRASLSEMFVPYADPSPTWRFRAAFDEGEYGMGASAVPFIPGADAPANAQLFPVTLSSETGSPLDMPNLIALYERDGGLLWRHTNYVDGAAETRRSRELVIASIATLGNYDYVFNWVFHQDGTLEQETLLSGIMQIKGEPTAKEARSAATREPYGTPVTPQIAAIYHQHFFNFRLDMDVDGLENCVKEMNVSSLPAGADNPDGNSFIVKQTTLASEKGAKRTLNPASARCWAVVNCAHLNALGQPVGYMLMPDANTVPFALPNSIHRRRAGFLDAPFWATSYDPTQRYAAGDYPNQSMGGEGLSTWIKADRPLENRDVVLWYTTGVTHIPRPEDWPVMPVHRTGFKLVPMGFFSRNPALDVPPVR